VKTGTVNIIEMAESGWKGRSGDNDQTTGSKGSEAPAYSNTAQTSPAIDPARPAAATLTQSAPTAPSAAAGALSNSPLPVTPALITPTPAEKAPDASPPAAPSTLADGPAQDRVPALLSHLEKLGAAEPKLAAWGDSGHLYRFSCRAALADSPSLTRHFESVAEEPAAAVEQVVAKVEAWRTAQRVDASMRY
jgi:hypothetical protein